MKTTKSSTLSQQAGAANLTPEQQQKHCIDWMERHRQALCNPETRFEQALVLMMRGWEAYSTAYRIEYETLIHADGVLGDAWAQIGDGLLGLLNGELGRLDGGSLDRTIRNLLEPLEDDTPPSAADEPEYVCSYSRAQALEDGVLIDVTETAKEAGFRYPVAMTAALWGDIHAIPERLKGIADSTGRLWDVLMLGKVVVAGLSDKRLSYCYHLDMPVGEATKYFVRINCGPGDDGEPVITLMQPGED